MAPQPTSGLPVALGLLLGGLMATVVPAGAAMGAGPVCMGVVVDEGNGTAPSVQGAQVAAGTSDLQALSDVGQSPVQNASGLVCTIGAYPANGLQNCLAASNGLYLYWSYWEGDPQTNTWTYASLGPASHAVSAGQAYVEGWRYQDPGPASPAATKPAVTPATAFAQACPGVPPGGSGGSSGGAGSGGPASGPAVTTTTATSPGTGTGAAATSSQAGPSAPSGSAPTAGSGGTGPPSSSRVAAPGGAPAGTGSSATSRRDKAIATAGANVAAQASPARADVQRSSGGSSLLPVLVVSVLVAAMAAVAWARWRRRPADGAAGE